MKTLLMPPRRAFADDAHYASVLALLDAADRLETSHSCMGDDRRFYAEWADRSALRVAPYLDLSSVERGPLHQTRPEWSRVQLLLRASIVHEQAKRILFEFRTPHLARFAIGHAWA